MPTTTTTTTTTAARPRRDHDRPRVRPGGRYISSAERTVRDYSRAVAPTLAALGVADRVAEVDALIARAADLDARARGIEVAGGDLVAGAVAALVTGDDVDAVTATIRKRRAELEAAALVRQALTGGAAACRQRARQVLADVVPALVEVDLAAVVAAAAATCADALDRVPADVVTADAAVAAGPEVAASWAEAAEAVDRVRAARSVLRELERLDAAPSRASVVDVPDLFHLVAQPWVALASVRDEPTPAHRLAALHRCGASPTLRLATTAADAVAEWRRRAEAGALPAGVVDPHGLDLLRGGGAR